MTRYSFAGTISDIVVDRFNFGKSSLLEVATSAELTFWDAATDGAQYTDLLLNGVAAQVITAAKDGQLPEFSGPDGVRKMWAQTPDGKRVIIATLDGLPGPQGDAGLGGSDEDVAGYVSGDTDTKAALDAAYAALDDDGFIDSDVIHDLDATQITSGVLDAERLPASESGYTLDEVYDEVASLQTSVPSNEDLMFTFNIMQDVTPAGKTWLLGMMPFDVTILGINIMTLGSVTASNTNYWTFTLDKYDGTTITPLTVRTTQVSGALANGGIASQKDWNFDGATWATRDVEAGWALRMAPVATGTPTDMPTRITATVRYQRKAA